MGDRPRSKRQMEDFGVALEDGNFFFYLKWKGNKYTWSNKHEDEAFTKEMLDKVVANSKWAQKFNDHCVEVLTGRSSDHRPLLLTMKMRGSKDIAACVQQVETRVTSEMNGRLVRPLCRLEIEEAIKHMGPLKSPSPDALIHKTKSPLFVIEYMPISLCNAIYKIISKVLVNRLKGVLPEIISPNQNAFILGRIIIDNIMVAYEILHTMKVRKKGKKGSMAIKLDMSKAYDRIEWTFLEAIMKKLGF
ncbi:uncharacterized protein LOC122299028 [Carya illinoinensis]|uniref:uncharacterized protein LOC122299028 n=1 Tax=Carya illinoinensis TaxID=32201 RepID=UPI001C718199|nr:uncharacterized protein LOC122299028 [Carya illinoinensis]